MTGETHATLLRRMARVQDGDAAENPLTTSRAVRLALTKAANDTVGLSLTVQSVGEDQARLDDMLAALPADLMLVRMERQGRAVGLIGLDMQMRAAVLEMETVGALLGAAAEDRAPTRTDHSLAMPLITTFLAAFPGAVMGTDLDGWLDGATATDRFANSREAGLILADCDYRIVQMRVDLGVAAREGLVLLALPLTSEAAEENADESVPVTWEKAFPAAVAEAPARLTALLHRFDVPLATTQGLAVGKVLPLTGCTVESVRLVSDDGLAVAEAKLGQMGGKRAVRLQNAPHAELAELSGGSAAPPPMPDMPSLPEPSLEPGLDMAGLGEGAPMMDAPPEEEMELLGDGMPMMGGLDIEDSGQL